MEPFVSAHYPDSAKVERRVRNILPLDPTVYHGTPFSSIARPYLAKPGAGNLVRQTIRINQTMAKLQYQLNALKYAAAKSEQREVYLQCKEAISESMKCFIA